MIRLLIEDVTLTKGAELLVQIRFKAGATKTLTLPLPMNAWQQRETKADVMTLIDRLLETLTDNGVAAELNRMGHTSGMNQAFTGCIVARLRREYQLVSTEERLRRRGLLSLEAMAHRLGISTTSVKIWRIHGLIVGHPYNDRNECLFEVPNGANIPRKQQGLKLSNRPQATKVLSIPPNEVHHAT